MQHIFASLYKHSTAQTNLTHLQLIFHNTNPHKYIYVTFDKDAKNTYIRGMIASSTNDVGKDGYPCVER